MSQKKTNHSSAFDADQVLFEHACATMPDSITRRRQVLMALKIKLNDRHPSYVNVCAQLAAVDTVIELQGNLQSQLALNL